MGHPFAIVLASPSLLAQSHVAAAMVPLGPDFAPKGEVRLASRSASDPVTTTASFDTGFAALPGMTVPITIPRGKVADVAVLFTGEMNSADVEFVRAVVDGVSAAPGVVQAFPGVHGSAASQAADFNAVLGEGDHTIQMQWGA